MKSGKDAGEWLPRRNRWFAAREGRALKGVLSGCASTGMVAAEGTGLATGAANALRRWDTNGNGRITCREARQHGIAPVWREYPAYPYRFMLDGDGDGDGQEKHHL